MIAREDTQTTGVNRQRFVQTEFKGKIGNLFVLTVSGM